MIESRFDRIRKKMEEAKALDPESSKGKKNLARLELAKDDISIVLDLEKQWLSDDDRFRLGVWTSGEEKPFIIHDEAVILTRFVLNEYRSDIARFKIAIVMQQGIPPVNRKGRLGTATKLPGKLKFLAGYDAVITLDFSHWAMLTDKDRQRLIHHELEHLQENDDGNGLCLRSHDFEDFTDVIELYGLHSESNRFSVDTVTDKVLVRAGAQLELLERAS